MKPEPVTMEKIVPDEAEETTQEPLLLHWAVRWYTWLHYVALCNIFGFRAPVYCHNILVKCNCTMPCDHDHHVLALGRPQ